MPQFKVTITEIPQEKSVVQHRNIAVPNVPLKKGETGMENLPKYYIWAATSRILAMDQKQKRTVLAIKVSTDSR